MKETLQIGRTNNIALTSKKICNRWNMPVRRDSLIEIVEDSLLTWVGAGLVIGNNALRPNLLSRLRSL